MRRQIEVVERKHAGGLKRENVSLGGRGHAHYVFRVGGWIQWCKRHSSDVSASVFGRNVN